MFRLYIWYAAKNDAKKEAKIKTEKSQGIYSILYTSYFISF